MRKRKEKRMKRIAILTTFQDFHPRYSLTGIVKDQVTMLTKHGHDVTLYVCENFNFDDTDFINRENLKNLIPFAHLKDYRKIADVTPDHKETIAKTAHMLVAELKDFDVAFTHDFVFTGWNLPYAEGCKRAGTQLPDLKWMHWIHSVPTAQFDWWDIRKYGPQHKLIFPNETDRLLVAEQYRGTIEDVRSIPHIKDLRSWFDFSDDTRRFIDAYPAVMQADIVQVLPASVDRLSAKRVKEVMQIFSSFKRQTLSVCLVIANQWATGKQQKENVEKYKIFAKSYGLFPGEEVIFTSDFESPKFDVGIPKEMVRELFQCSNLFIFPTREESFGLVVPEAALSGGVLLVLNKSLRMQLEVSGGSALFFDFGSYHHEFHCPDPDIYYKDVAKIIYGRMAQNESIQSKTFARQTYNWDNLYRMRYEPILAESRNWK
jgi:glycosyltransferase involved in cell wall biosynthesis